MFYEIIAILIMKTLFTCNSRIRKPVRKTVRRENIITGAVTKYLGWWSNQTFVPVNNYLDIKSPKNISFPCRIVWLRLPSNLAQSLLSLEISSRTSRGHRLDNNLILNPGFWQHFTLSVYGSPLMRKFCWSPLPRLKIQSCPDDIEEGEDDKPNVIHELSFTLEEYLQQ